MKRIYKFISPLIIFAGIDRSDIAASYRYIDGIVASHRIPEKNIILFKESPVTPSPYHTIPLGRIMTVVDPQKTVPHFHTYSRFHYQVLFKRFQDVIGYSDYCLLEEQIAKIIEAYIGIDEPRLFIFEDEGWLNDESVMSYFTAGEKERVERYTIRNLDVYPEMNILPSEVKKIYFWDKRNHPFL